MYNKVFKSYQLNNLSDPFKIVTVFKNEEEQNKEQIDEELDLEAIIKEKENELLKEANNNAKLIIAEANKDALQVMDDANEEAEKIKNLAYDSAYSEGFAKAQKDFQEENLSILTESESIRDDAKKYYEETINNLESDILRLTMEIARKVIGTELKTNKEIILSLLKDAFKRTNEKENITIKVSEEDSEILKDNIQGMIGRETGISNVKLKKNMSFNQGDLIIETPYGSIDGSVENKLSNIENAFNEFVVEDNDSEE